MQPSGLPCATQVPSLPSSMLSINRIIGYQTGREHLRLSPLQDGRSYQLIRVSTFLLWSCFVSVVYPLQQPLRSLISLPCCTSFPARLSLVAISYSRSLRLLLFYIMFKSLLSAAALSLLAFRVDAAYINYTTVSGYFLQDDAATNPSSFDYVCHLYILGDTALLTLTRLPQTGD